MSQAIEAVVVPCFRGDFWLAKICVASIRYWYPHITIRLLVDQGSGNIDTSELIALGMPPKANYYVHYRNHLAKIEALFLTDYDRILLLDADTVLLGPLLNYLEQYTGDLVVSSDDSTDPRVANPYSEYIQSVYYDFGRLLALDPDFRYPGYTFNTGQMVIATGTFTREDFKDFVDQEVSPPRLRYQNTTFKCGEQGLLNYVAAKLAAQKRLTITRPNGFYCLPGESCIPSLASIRKRNGIPRVLHWVGPKFSCPYFFPNRDILLFYQRVYYEHFAWSRIRRSAVNLGSLPRGCQEWNWSRQKRNRSNSERKTACAS